MSGTSESVRKVNDLLLAMSGSHSASDGHYATNVVHTANETTITTKPLRPDLPAAEVTIDRARGDDGSVTVTVKRKR